MAKALPYHEPSILTLLIISSFFLVLNIINYGLDHIIYCGLVGQILIGMAWGAPGVDWLEAEFQNAAVSVGYLGLILLVYEGGLSTSLKALKANLVLSTTVALTGIGLPIGFSYSLTVLTSATSLQAFAAGAALCSTSLGTTFTILNTSGLARTKLGTVLTSAAMMDDVVGLVLVQVISNIGGSTTSLNSITVVRPLAVSVGFVVLLLVACRFLVAPTTRLVLRRSKRDSAFCLLLRAYRKHVAFLAHTMVLVGLVVGATYAGTSGLFAAYLAGASISWWDSEFLTGDSENNGNMVTATATETQEAEPAPNELTSQEGGSPANAASEAGNRNDSGVSDGEQIPVAQTAYITDATSVLPTGLQIYEAYYLPTVDRILKPLFFASIGFAIPITDMFRGAIIWRGLVYSVLMFFGKVLTGVWLVRVDFTPPRLSFPSRWKRLIHFCLQKLTRNGGSPSEKHGQPENSTPHTAQNEQLSSLSSQPVQQHQNETKSSSPRSYPWPKPRSLYPASILGVAMVARGEIGFLIASLAESNGIFAASNPELNSSPQSSSTGSTSSEIYLVVTWAIMLCTIVGPLGVGVLVKRLKRLQRQREMLGGPDPLGVWGVL